MGDIRQWLERHGLGEHAELLTTNEVDFEVLPELEESDLEKIGLSLGARKKLLKAIRGLHDPAAADQKGRRGPQASLSGDAERRQLTVMFADLVGSTALSRDMDPEDLREINRAYQDAATAAIEKYDGYVARYMGDGVLAYFGFPRAHEDDAERSLRAGLELVQSISSLETAVELAVRVGIATGPVVVGDIVGEGAAQESAVVGETPNLAARLQGIAAPNTVVLAATTRHLVAGQFELDSLGMQSLKGIDQPVPAYRAVAVRSLSRFDASRERGLTPLVGRDEELGILTRRWKLAVEGDGQAVLLAAEAGVGKSRIVRALQDSLVGSLSNRVLCYCSPYHRSSAFHPAIEQLERASGIESGQGPKEKLEALENVLKGLEMDVDRIAPLLADLLSIPHAGIYPELSLTPEQRRLRTLEVMVEMVEAMAIQAPVLFVAEDVHWIDSSTQDFLTHLIERVRTSRTLLIVTFRPQYEPLWADYSHVTALALNHLGRHDTAAMVAKVTGGRTLPSSMVEQIIERTDGVPLFIEEVTAALEDSGFMAEEDGSAPAAGGRTPTDIPATLQDLIAERLDRLGRAKETAQHAAVIGRSFTFELLRAISSRDEQILEQDLSILLQSGLIHGRKGVGSDYDFKHALVRDVAYQSLLKRDRRACHQRIATNLLATAGDKPALELIAHHFEEAHDLDSAVRYWRQAAERALRGFAHVEAISDLRRALAAMKSLPANNEQRRIELELQTMLGPSLMYVFGQGAPEVEQTYARALELGEQLDDAQASFTSAWGLWRLQFARGDMNAGRELALKCQQASPHRSPIREMIAQPIGFTSIIRIAGNTHLYWQDSKKRCGFKGQARAREFGERCGLVPASPAPW